MWKIPLFSLNYDERERQAVNEVIDSGWLTMGPKTAEFEAAFSVYHGGEVQSLAVSSCTAALHLSLLAAGIGPGDEVIVSGLSFVACLNLVTLMGAKPVLADCCSHDDWNINPEDVEVKITPRTKAILFVHFAGYPCDMKRLCDIAKNNNIIMIEDVAHAVGASIYGSKCGTFGDIACFSFFSNKNLSVGEGGMVLTRHPELHEKLRLLRSHGMTSLTVDRHNQKSISYDVMMPGLNYRIDEMRSALGLVQLSKLDEANAQRGKLVQRYHDNLVSMPQLVVPWPKVEDSIKPSWHIFPLLLPIETNRLDVMEKFRISGIQTSLHYPAYRDFSAYKNNLFGDIPVATEISQRVLTLPLYPNMTEEMIDGISSTLAEIIDGSH